MRLRYRKVVNSLFAPLGLVLFFVADARPQSSTSVVALVDGAEITEDELNIQAQTAQLKKQEYDLKARAVENAVSRKILEKAAAAKNLTAEEFLRQEVDSKISEPTPAELEGFYWGQKDKFSEPLEKIREQVAQALKRAKIHAGRQALLQKLREQAAVRVLIERPRFAVETGNAPRRGSATAPVTIVELGDYQCPYCKRIQGVLHQLSAKYGNQLSFVFKDLPLNNIHPQAQAAAEAAHCAGEQGKYWEYHDALFEMPAIRSETLLEAAQKVQIDEEAFKTCVAARKHKELVERNSQEVRQLGINGTPAFFINGVLLSGAQPITAFESVIDSELESAKARAAGQ